MSGPKIRPLDADAVAAIVRQDGGNGWKNDAAAWRAVAAEHGAGERVVLVAWDGGDAVGYGSLRWRSDYPAFAARGVPEIFDLATARAHRRRGVASALIAQCERLAAGRGARAIGIGVGLYADYGPAQRLYVTLGYRPDGRGVTSGHETVAPGAMVLVDDDLVLWLTKPLG